jgi:hypothetical protein
MARRIVSTQRRNSYRYNEQRDSEAVRRGTNAIHRLVRTSEQFGRHRVSCSSLSRARRRRYNDEQLGGFESSLSRLLASDPSCVASRILATGLELMGTSTPSADLRAKTAQSLGEMSSSDRYIQLHCQALVHWSNGHYGRASETWEHCLVLYPFDMMTVKFVCDTYFYLGNREMLRDSIARILPLWDASSERPLKSYLHGMYAFGLAETNMFDRAEEQARLGLELNANDAWATHALAHAFEYTGRTSEGIAHLHTTKDNWKKCDIIRPHIEWHWALFELERGNRDIAEDILNNQILNVNTEMIMLDFVDVASLIYRLKLAGHGRTTLSSSARLQRFLKEHLHDHVLLFNDLHMYFLFDEHNGNADDRQDFVRTLHDVYDASQTDNGRVYRQVARHIFDAIDRFNEKNYAQVVQLLYPIRNQIYQIGGSNAQRDLFYLMLVHAAVHSSDGEHQQLARQLINERCQLRNKTQSKVMQDYGNRLLHE